jgi:hypothetical protein
VSPLIGVTIFRVLTPIFTVEEPKGTGTFGDPWLIFALVTGLGRINFGSIFDHHFDHTGKLPCHDSVAAALRGTVAVP